MFENCDEWKLSKIFSTKGVKKRLSKVTFEDVQYAVHVLRNTKQIIEEWPSEGGENNEEQEQDGNSETANSYAR